MGGADGGGLVILRGESQDGLSRDYSKYVFGYRAIDPTVTDPMNRGFYDATQPVYTFTDPMGGPDVEAQYVRPGIDRVLDMAGDGSLGGTVGLLIRLWNRSRPEPLRLHRSEKHQRLGPLRLHQWCEHGELRPTGNSA